MAPPLIDTSIVPEVPGVLYALFDYGLTLFKKKSVFFWAFQHNRVLAGGGDKPSYQAIYGYFLKLLWF